MTVAPQGSWTVSRRRCIKCGGQESRRSLVMTDRYGRKRPAFEYRCFTVNCEASEKGWKSLVFRSESAGV